MGNKKSESVRRSTAPWPLEVGIDETILAAIPILAGKILADIHHPVCDAVPSDGDGFGLLHPAPIVHVAAELANDPTARAILVADECPLESRAKVEAMLAGHRDRVRVIAIDNASDSVLGLSPQLRLDKMPMEKVDEVLSSNFPGISADR